MNFIELTKNYHQILNNERTSGKSMIDIKKIASLDKAELLIFDIISHVNNQIQVHMELEIANCKIDNGFDIDKEESELPEEIQEKIVKIHINNDDLRKKTEYFDYEFKKKFIFLLKNNENFEIEMNEFLAAVLNLEFIDDKSSYFYGKIVQKINYSDIELLLIVSIGHLKYAKKLIFKQKANRNHFLFL